MFWYQILQVFSSTYCTTLTRLILQHSIRGAAKLLRTPAKHTIFQFTPMPWFFFLIHSCEVQIPSAHSLCSECTIMSRAFFVLGILAFAPPVQSPLLCETNEVQRRRCICAASLQIASSVPLNLSNVQDRPYMLPAKLLDSKCPFQGSTNQKIAEVRGYNRSFGGGRERNKDVAQAQNVFGAITNK